MPLAPHIITTTTALTLPHVERGQGRVDAPTVGSSGRVWRLPFSIEHAEGLNQVRFSGPTEHDAALSTCRFLRAHTPDLFEEWRNQIVLAQLRDNPSRGLPFAMRALADTGSIADMIAAPGTEKIEAPRSVHIPTVGEEHWFRRRHQTVGNYIACSKDPIRDSQLEFEQDYSCLTFYLSRYNTLAETYSGEALFEATTWASFRDPYFSCMQMCLFDLNLPQSFMALVNHGIGAQLAMGQRFCAWAPWHLADQDQRLLATSREVFKELTRLFIEDFPFEPT
jgi:hypothetical protein